MAVVQEHEKGGIGKYLVVYVAILILAGLQFVIAYQHIDGAQMFARMFFVAVLEAGLALMFFMHLWAEKRGFAVELLSENTTGERRRVSIRSSKTSGRL